MDENVFRNKVPASGTQKKNASVERQPASDVLEKIHQKRLCLEWQEEERFESFFLFVEF